MSGQSSQRARRIASPSTPKQGPMKATLTFGLVQGSPTRALNARKNSPSSSPTLLWPAEGHRVKVKRSPDLTRTSPERSSPCSPAFKVEHPKPVRLSPSSTAKRAGSLDTIAGPYLTGHWPRCDLTASNPSLSAQPQDKATQTPEWELEEGADSRKRLSVHKRSSSLSNVDTIKDARAGVPPPEPKSAFKIIKSRLAKTKEGNRLTSAQRTSPIQGSHLSLGGCAQITTAAPGSTQTTASGSQSKAVAIPSSHIPKSRMRGSVEGPNQEIERALRSISGLDGEELQRAGVGWLQTTEPTPDGHRAPILELVTRTVDTQTPSAYMEELRISSKETSQADLPRSGSSRGCGGASSSELVLGKTTSEPSSSEPSDSPEYGLIPGHMDTSRPSSRDETPPAEGCESPNITKETTAGDSDNCLEAESPQGSLLKCVPSPRPNKSFSFAREPPDGCEKVKLMEETRSAPPLKEPLLYCPIQKTSQYHIPSVGSAFCPLYKTYIVHQAAGPGVLTSGAEAQ